MTVVKIGKSTLGAMAADLMIAVVGSVAAFALDARGSGRLFVISALLFFAIGAGGTWFTVRALKRERGVEPLPGDAAIRPDTSIWRRVPLWALFVAVTAYILGTQGPGMALGASLGGVLAAWRVQRWASNRGVELFRPEKREEWSFRRSSEPWLYTRPKVP